MGLMFIRASPHPHQVALSRHIERRHRLCVASCHDLESQIGRRLIRHEAIGNHRLVSSNVICGDMLHDNLHGIVSRRDLKGNEKWRVTSREIGAGAVTVSEGQIYTLGYKGKDHFTPLVHPAASASSGVQNQRLPPPTSILIFA
jgi:hypothetical protein